MDWITCVCIFGVHRAIVSSIFMSLLKETCGNNCKSAVGRTSINFVETPNQRPTKSASFHSLHSLSSCSGHADDVTMLKTCTIKTLHGKNRQRTKLLIVMGTSTTLLQV